MVRNKNLKPKVIGLTGNIGCGKTEILEIFRKKKAKTLNADSIVEKAYLEKNVQKNLMELFGAKSKKIISKTVLMEKSKAKLRQLEKIIHPIVLKKIKLEIEKFKKPEKNIGKVFVIEVPLLFELNLEKLFDKTIVVFAGMEKRIERMAKRGYSRAKTLEIDKMQIPLIKKTQLADIVIDNGKSVKNSENQVEKILEKFKTQKNK